MAMGDSQWELVTGRHRQQTPRTIHNKLTSTPESGTCCGGKDPRSAGGKGAFSSSNHVVTTGSRRWNLKLRAPRPSPKHRDPTQASFPPICGARSACAPSLHPLLARSHEEDWPRWRAPSVRLRYQGHPPTKTPKLRDRAMVGLNLPLPVSS